MNRLAANRRALRFAGLPALALLLVCVGPTPADEIILNRGKRKGTLVKTEGGVAYINPYNSTNPRMTFGVETVPAAKVKKVIQDAAPHRVYLRKLNQLRPPGGKADARSEYELGVLAERLKLGQVAVDHFLRTLSLDPDHPEARKRFDAYELKRLQKADPRSNPELRDALNAWRRLDSLKARRAELDRLGRRTGFKRSLVYMERVRRSASRPTGLRIDVTLSLNSKDVKSVYTLFVPKRYDPMHPWPLVFALHGGGRDGKDGKDVIGTGRGAMNFWSDGARRFGYIVVCPDAIRAPWRDPMNDALVQSVLDEVCLLYNVDLNRIYLTGHSMGGFGTWHFGPKYAHRWAVIAPMAGGGHHGLNRLRKTQTPVYIYHGANDNVVPCHDSRAAAESLRKAGDDFIYTEIPDSGHGFPRDVNAEAWRFFHHRRLAVTANRSPKGRFKVALQPYSSFNLPVSRAERLYFGAPGEEPVRDVKTLITRIKLGGGVADEAAEALAALEDRSAVKPLAALAVSKRQPDDVRRAAIRVLGRLKLPEAARPLQKALRTVPVDLVPETADALAGIEDPKSLKALTRAMARMRKEFDGRLLGGNQMRFSDWKRCMTAFAGVARALGRSHDPAGLKPIEKLVETVLLEEWQPERSRRAGLNPDVPLGRCVCDVLEAVGAIGDPGGRDLIEGLAKKHGRLSGVGKAADRARSRLAAAQPAGR
jgi:predicted esterase